MMPRIGCLSGGCTSDLSFLLGIKYYEVPFIYIYILNWAVFCFLLRQKQNTFVNCAKCIEVKETWWNGTFLSDREPGIAG